MYGRITRVKLSERRYSMSGCKLCPRLCGADRVAGQLGFCGQGDTMRVCRAAPHMFEEPPISGERGSGTVFFAGCSLGCIYCQNRKISRGGEVGKKVSPHELADIFFELRDMGVHNINLVTAAHFADKVKIALEIAKPTLGIPVVYNSSGYERVETLKALEGLVDIYLPDFKYASGELARKYSHAEDYPKVAIEALREMHRQTGKYAYGEDGMLKRGVVVRHLILPSLRKDSMQALDMLANALPPSEILLSLMSQYTPDFALDTPYPELHRRITSFEYNSVLKYALSLGFDGFMQERNSATKNYTPDF